MNNPKVVDLISKVIGEPTYSYYWYSKVESLVDFPIKISASDDWKIVYDILSKENNYFSSLEATNILLKIGFDPSLNESESLTIASRSGSAEVVQLLLSDKRVDPLATGAYNALKLATELGRLDVMRVLLRDQRIRQSSVLSSILEQSILEKHPEALKLLIREHVFNSRTLNYWLATSVKLDALDIMTLLLQDPKTDINARDGYALTQAIKSGKIEAVKLLLKNEKISISPQNLEQAVISDASDILRLLLEGRSISRERRENLLDLAAQHGSKNVARLLLEDKTLKVGENLLSRAVDNWRSEVVGILLRDGRVDPEARDNYALRTAVRNRDVNTVEVLLSDERTDFTGDIVAELLDSSRELSDGIINALIRRPSTNLQDIPADSMDYIISHTREYTSGAIEGSEMSEESILEDLRTSGSFNRRHYNMLLRELILKRLDMEYYLRWILKELKKTSTSAKTRELFSAAAGTSLDVDRVVHTSAFFTAYLGFLVFSLTSDKELVMKFLSIGDEVTPQGLDLAGGLIGAYLGGRKRS